MRVVRVFAGLGNQMFQYVIYCQLKKLNSRVYIDTSGVSDRPYELYKWNVPLSKLPPLLASFFNNDENYIWNRIYIHYRGLKKILYMKNLESAYKYFEDYRNKEYKYYEGYWQNLKYFEGVEQEIRQAFDINKITFQPRNIRWKKKIDDVESIGIHVRGFDFLISPFKELYGGICTTEYYEKAINYMDSQVKDPVYFVFTNDLEYAKKILPKKEYIFVEGNTAADDVEEMMLMRSCKHQIIPNSTFSWWAAWLNDNPSKHVVMPEIWVNGAVPPNIAEDGWKVIKSNSQSQ